MTDTKYNILIYFDNHTYRKIAIDVNSSYAENLQIFLHDLSLFSYDAVIIGAILYENNVSKIITAIREITLIPIIVLIKNPLLHKKELIYAGADCVMDINSTMEEIDVHLFSLIRRNKEWKTSRRESAVTILEIVEGNLYMSPEYRKISWNNIEIHLTQQEYDFLYLLASSPRRIYTFEQIYQIVWKDYPVGNIRNIIWCLVKRLRKKLNTVENGAGNCIVSVRDIGYKFELNKEHEKM